MGATPSIRLEADEQQRLLETAASAIESRLGLGPAAAAPDPASLPAAITRPAASFVTLNTAAGLRGCCGTLEASRALALDVWRNAQASAFADPRFDPLAAPEWSAVTTLEVCVLSALEAVAARSEARLLQRLRPGVDGVVLTWAGRRATFLPKVWEHLSDPGEFVRQLKLKAGWQADFWAPEVAIHIYGTSSFTLEFPARRRLSTVRD
jgi:AmmeMemoRadiSam system protein A